MPRRADTPTRRRGLAAALAEAESHRSCSASLSPSTLLSRASSASLSFIFSSKVLCSCSGRGAELRAGETSRNKCWLPPELSRCGAGCRGARGLFAPSLRLHTGQTDGQTDRQRHRRATDGRRPAPSPWDAGRHKAAQCLKGAHK